MTFLHRNGVPLTGGQMLGGIAKSVEDKLTSVPGVGDLIARRRIEGLQAFNRKAFDEAGQPIGFSPTAIGNDGVEQIIGNEVTQGAAGSAYDKATAGVTVPLDLTTAADIRAALAKGRALPDDLATRFALAAENRVKPAVDGGVLTGEGYQQAVRGLKSYRAEATKPGFEADYRDALTGLQDALTGAMTRGGGADVVTGLKNADASYRMGKILQDAVKRARNGSRSGEVETFTPSQLNDAAVANRYSGIGTTRPFYDLATAGQRVLPSFVPDSGTAGRMTMGLLAGGVGLPGAGAGIDYATGSDKGFTIGGLGLTTLATLAALNTKGGQRALSKALLDRPAQLVRVGDLIVNKAAYPAGRLGAATGAYLGSYQ